MKYIELVKEAEKNGVWNEKSMWHSVESISDMLEELKDEHPQMFWRFMREQYGIMSGCHYNERWATHDVSKLEWTDKEGKKHTGAHWTVEEIEEATKGKTFPNGVTRWDKFVAYNAAWSDLCKVLDDEKILCAAYAFWFADEDWGEKGSGTKIFRYMECKYS